MNRTLALVAAAALGAVAAPALATTPVQAPRMAVPATLRFDRTMVVDASLLTPFARYLVSAGATGPVHTDCLGRVRVWARADADGRMRARLLIRPGWPRVWCTMATYEVRLVRAGTHVPLARARVVIPE